jgi:hypothetical protein
MSEPIYKLFILKGFKDAWYQLPKEEQDRIGDAAAAFDKSVGGEYVLLCNTQWANEATLGFGVVKYPSVEAAQENAAKNEEWLRYVEAESILGTKVEMDTNADRSKQATPAEAG